MNKKIISLFVSAIMALSNAAVCMADDSEKIVFDTAHELCAFMPTYASASVSGDVLECEISDAERSGIRTAIEFRMKDYDNVNISMSYENIDNPSSNALEYNGNVTPALRLGLKVIDILLNVLLQRSAEKRNLKGRKT